MAKRRIDGAVPLGSELPYNPDDDQLVAVLTQDWDGKVSYFHGQFHVYEAGCWIPREREEVARYARRFLAKYREQLGKGGVSQARVSAVTTMLKDDVFVPDRKITTMQEENAKYINLSNGLFNLETFKLEPHRKDYLDTTQLEFGYDEEADCPTFRRYLRTSLVTADGTPDERMIELVQEALAYSMTARTDLKASFWLVGKPDSGKSTLIGFIRSMMGSLHSTIDLNQLATNRFLLSGIVGKRVVTFTEADSNLFIPDALYKAMVGGQDEIYVDVKNRPGIAFVPTAKFWWAMNSAPRFSDRSGATLNRLHVILFDRSVPQSERINNLNELLKAERAGVFNWLLLGYKRLLRAGKFTNPERSQAWRQAYSEQNDTEQSFIAERMEIGADFRIGGAELYRQYRDYCDDNGFRAKNSNQVSSDWERLGLKRLRSNGRTFWTGIRVRQDGLLQLDK